VVQEYFVDKTVQRRVTRSQLAKEKGNTVIDDESLDSKGNLNDLL